MTIEDHLAICDIARQLLEPSSGPKQIEQCYRTAVNVFAFEKQLWQSELDKQEEEKKAKPSKIASAINFLK